MTIREYIKIHTLDSFVNHYSIIVKPFSLCEKYNHYDLIEAESRIRQKVDKWIYLTLWFYNLENLAKKVDFNLELKKVEVSWSSQYSNDAEPETTFFIDDVEFIKIAKMCDKSMF